ncbi:MerR family transcriptional regulator [Alkalibaculum bacchi]|uniref:MerR family transcriptional regulator n=1 Tax=Alkalibaculum bacchi TaxID=645887 RepID=A0A366IA00_9FIRM|nr:MerR family transcriptional regulator [Alkalibaculum bacchi]
MLKYKIGEVSKILNIPLQTIRYYESKNIINPEIDHDNQYRYFDAWDINFLLEYKKYRSFDFSQLEIKEILYQDTLEEFTERIEDRQAYFNKQLKYYELLTEKNKIYIDSLNTINENLNQYSITTQPEIYYFMHRFNYEYDSKEKMDGLFEIWLDYLPFVDYVVEMKEEYILSRDKVNKYNWGFAIKREHLEAFDLPLNEKVIHIEERPCVYTVICAGEKGTFSLKLLDGVMEYIEKEGYRLVGDIIGNLLVRTHEATGYSRFIEIWVPIKEK